MLALSRFWSAWRLLHPLTNRSSTCGLRSSLPRPVGVMCRGRECGNQQLRHVISSSLHVVHAVHASGAYQQAAGAPMSPTAALHQPRPSWISSPDFARLS